MITAALTIIGAAHVDQTIRLDGPVNLHRTNGAQQNSLPGGVAANMARHLASEHRRETTTGRHAAKFGIQFVGVASHQQSDSLQRQMAAAGVKATFVLLDGPTPSYTAILDNDGDLVIGAACMDLYDAVTPADIIPHLPRTGGIVMDANFPADLLAAVAAEIPMAMSLYAAGTSVEKVQRLTPILDRLDGLVVNRAEAERLTEVTPLPEIAADIAGRMRPRAFILISDGGNEAVLAQDGIVVTAMPPAFDPDDDTINVNGAGDAMAARLFGLYLHGASRQRPTGDMLDSLLQTALSAGAAFAAGETNA